METKTQQARSTRAQRITSIVPHTSDNTRPKTEVETITPEQARIILSVFATKNRGLREQEIERMADLMLENRWFIAEPIIFNENGILIDGYHRLNAVVRAAIPVDFVVIRGVQHEAMHVIDTGLRRSLPDRLIIGGELPMSVSNKNLFAGVIARMQAGPGRPSLAATRDYSFVVDFVHRYQDALEAISSLLDMKNMQGVRTSPVIAAVARSYYHIKRDTFEAFVRGLLNQSIDGDPLHGMKFAHYALTRFSKNGGTNLRGRIIASQAYLITEAALVAADEDRNVVVYRPLKAEAFPLPDRP